MALKDYVSDEGIEKVAMAFVKEILEPALKKLVAESSNPYDDIALAAAMPMIIAAVSKISDDAPSA